MLGSRHVIYPFSFSLMISFPFCLSEAKVLCDKVATTLQVEQTVESVGIHKSVDEN